LIRQELIIHGRDPNNVFERSELMKWTPEDTINCGKNFQSSSNNRKRRNPSQNDNISRNGRAKPQNPAEISEQIRVQQEMEGRNGENPSFIPNIPPNKPHSAKISRNDRAGRENFQDFNPYSRAQAQNKPMNSPLPMGMKPHPRVLDPQRSKIKN